MPEPEVEMLGPFPPHIGAFGGVSGFSKTQFTLSHLRVQPSIARPASAAAWPFWESSIESLNSYAMELNVGTSCEPCGRIFGC